MTQSHTDGDLSYVELARKDRAPLCARFADADGRDIELGTDLRPSWRGRVHLIGFCIAVPCVAALIVFAQSARARVGVAIYAAGLCSMLFTSTTYHRWVHQLKSRAAWRRADHAMIFAAIAGSTTPALLILMPGGLGIALLAAVGVVSMIGALCKVAHWQRGDAVGSALYATVGVMAALAVPAMFHQGGVVAGVLYLSGGALYTMGAFWFAKNRPRLRPSVFSYHEVWHVFTIAAAAAHFGAIWIIAT
ncbi:MAG: hemolysin [Ilumatobacteraceae bacterium]|nr:hemolysin [Ilumatobacteraceae bacterium]